MTNIVVATTCACSSETSGFSLPTMTVHQIPGSDRRSPRPQCSGLIRSATENGMKKSMVLPGVKLVKQGSATPTIMVDILFKRTMRPTAERSAPKARYL